MYICRADYYCFQIELAKNYGVSEWREDVKNCLLKAGLQNLPVVFLFTDTQVESTSTCTMHSGVVNNMICVSVCLSLHTLFLSVSLSLSTSLPLFLSDQKRDIFGRY